jgi:hypothetical protein
MVLFTIAAFFRLPSRMLPTQVSLKSHSVRVSEMRTENAPSAPIQPWELLVEVRGRLGLHDLG